MTYANVFIHIKGDESVILFIKFAHSMKSSWQPFNICAMVINDLGNMALSLVLTE